MAGEYYLEQEPAAPVFLIDPATSKPTSGIAIQPPVVAAANAPLNASSTVYATSLVIKASAGILFGLTGHNSLAAAQFIQLHDAASLPADAAVPVVVILVAASSSFSLDYGSLGRYFATGIVVTNSSTGPTKTIGAANCWFDAQYV